MAEPKSTGARTLAPVRRLPRADVTELILKAVCAYKDRRGISTHALKKELAVQGFDVEDNNRVIKGGINWLLSQRAIVHTTPKGHGAIGSFKPGEAAEEIAEKLAASTQKKANAKSRPPKKSEADKDAAK